MARNDNFFNRLTRLFRSGPAIQRKVKGYNYNNYFDNDIIRGNYGYRAPFPFGRESSPFSVLGAYGLLDRMSRYAEFAEMEYCLIGDTKIAVPGGYKTIKELADEYGLEKEFIVYSYDHNKKQIVPAIGKQARQTRVDHAYRVVFDSGKEIIGTANHRLLKRDGTYSEIRDLKPGDAMMPFYRKDLLSSAKSDEGEGYRWIYTMNKSDSTMNNGWISEHRLIASWIAGRKLQEDEVVHHRNFVKFDNRPENLQIMTETEHASYHSILNNEKKWNVNNQEWITEFKKRHSDWMTKNNPAERKDITFDRILNWCLDNSFNISHVCKAFDTDPNVIKRKLRAKGFDNFVMFARAYQPGWRSDSWNNAGNKNPRFNSSITFNRICSNFEKGISQETLAERLGCSITPITNRLKDEGFNSWSDFANNYENHKVVSVEYYGLIPLYDLTVDGYKNFATDSVISHNTPEIAAALNIYADECTTGDERGKTFHIISSNPQIKKSLDELFYDILNIEFNLRPWIRNLVKYGDLFLYNEVIPDIGVVNVQPIRVNELEREEGWDPNDPYAVRFKWLTRGNRYLENWQVTHMRILGNDMFLPYGTSVLEPARRIWRQLIMMEDSMLVYRVVRSPERRVFYIDVGNIAPNDIPSYMEQAKQTLRARDVVSRTDGRVDQRYNPLSVDDDYFIPVRGGQTGTKIETLAGGQNATATEDVEYLQKKLFAAIQVPKPYLNFTEGMSAKASLAQQDVRFSRTIIALQKIAIAELNKLAMIHLYAKGFNEEDLLDFNLKLANPSTIALLQKLENLASKFDIAAKAKETKLVDELWIQKNIIELSDDELMNIEQGRRQDKVREVELESIAVSANPDPGPARTVSPFDNSNYQMTGGDVSRKAAPEEDDFFQKMDDYSEVQNYKKDQEEKTFAYPNVDGTSPPVQATPFVKRAEKNRERRVGAGGRSNLEMPDFGAMFDRKNVSLTDIYDRKFLDNPLLEKILEEQLGLNVNKTIPRDFIATLNNLKLFLEQNRMKAKIIREENEQIEIKMDEDELLIESVGGTEDSSSDEKKVNISEIDLSTLD